MNGERISFWSKLLICILGGVLLGFILLKYALPILLPFLFAWAAAFICRPIAGRLNRKIKIPERIIRPVLSLFCIFAILSLGAFLVIRAVNEAVGLLSGLSENEELMKTIASILNPTFGIEDGGIAVLEERLAQAIDGILDSLISALGGILTNAVSYIPGAFIFVITLIISSVYFAFDLENINRAVRRHLPPKVEEFAVRFKNNFLAVGVKYLRSYLLIMLITFSVVLIGLLFLRVPYALLIALVISLLDILPVLGVGTVLVPWSIWRFILGDARLGVGLLVLLIVNEIVRQFAEPKIVGKSLGLHPLLTLVLMYAGYCLLGFAGLLLLPVFAVSLNTLLASSADRSVGEVEGGSDNTNAEEKD